jgi:2-dehydro-3-deoxygluconokinase
MVSAPLVVTAGEAMLRLAPPQFGRIEAADSLELQVAGSESNVAMALASLGFRARWLSRLPDSPLGRRVAAELASAGVDLQGVRWVPDARLGLFFVEFGQPPRPSRVWYDRAESAAAALTPDDVDDALFDDASYAVVSGITSALAPAAHAFALRFVDAARSAGATICVDLNYRERLWTAAQARGPLAQLASAADIVICGARDARRLFDIDGTGAAALEALRAACAPMARLLVITRSTEGAVALTRDGSILEQPAIPAVVVDRIGAGDAFLAGLIWGLERGGEASALKAAAAAAALKCTIAGDRLRTSEAELRELLDDPSIKDVVR